jgi:hypothetical protein
LCDAGPRFQVWVMRSKAESRRACFFALSAFGLLERECPNLQPAPGRDSYWSRAEPRHRPSAECVFGPRAPRPRPASTLRLAKRPLADKADGRIREVWEAGISRRLFWSRPTHLGLVTPAKAGVQFLLARTARWTPAFAGMTRFAWLTPRTLARRGVEVGSTTGANRTAHG